MTAILVACRNQLTGEKCVENSAQFDIQMMFHPFRVKFRVMRDFYRFVGGKKFSKRRKFFACSQIAAFRKRLQINNLRVRAVAQLHKPNFAFIRIERGRFRVETEIIVCFELFAYGAQNFRVGDKLKIYFHNFMVDGFS